MEKHFLLLAGLFIGLGILGSIAIIVILFIFSMGSVAIGIAAAQDPEVPRLVPFLPATVGIVISFIIAITTLPNFIAAYGLLKRKSWARIVSLIVGVINLAVFPLGTATGIYAIWVLLQDRSTEELTE